MKAQFSSSWEASKKPSKQRKYRANAPLHIKRKFLSAHLTKELRQKHKKRAIEARKGDLVKVMRGQHKGRTGKIEKVNTKSQTMHVEGISTKKIDGSSAPYPLHPSNLMIIQLNLDDKRRLNKK